MVKIQCRKDFERMPSTSTADDSSDCQSIVMGSNHEILKTCTIRVLVE